MKLEHLEVFAFEEELEEMSVEIGEPRLAESLER